MEMLGGNVSSRLCELEKTGLVCSKNGRWTLTDRGRDLLKLEPTPARRRKRRRKLGPVAVVKPSTNTLEGLVETRVYEQRRGRRGLYSLLKFESRESAAKALEALRGRGLDPLYYPEEDPRKLYICRQHAVYELNRELGLGLNLKKSQYVCSEEK